MNAVDIISQAYYLANVVSREFETVSASQLSDGLTALNDILSEKGATGNLIPYYKKETFNMTTGQATYDIPGLITAQTITFLVGTVRYPITIRGNQSFFGSVRPEGISSLPLTGNLQRIVGGTRLHVYFLPIEDYRVEVYGKFYLDQIETPQQEMNDLDRFYLSYLKYELCQRLCDLFGKEFTQAKMATLVRLRRQMARISPPDNSVRPNNALNNNTVDPQGVVFRYWGAG
jgi:hypothetical protein